MTFMAVFWVVGFMGLGSDLPNLGVAENQEGGDKPRPYIRSRVLV